MSRYDSLVTGTRRDSVWTSAVVWRLGVAAVLCTAVTAAGVVLVAVMVGQLSASSPAARDVGLALGLALFGASVAFFYGLAGGLLAALGAVSGVFLARRNGLSNRGGAVVVGSFASLGAFCACLFTRPSALGSWVIIIVGAVIVGAALVGSTVRFTRTGPAPQAASNATPSRM